MSKSIKREINPEIIASPVIYRSPGPDTPDIMRGHYQERNTPSGESRELKCKESLFECISRDILGFFWASFPNRGQDI